MEHTTDYPILPPEEAVWRPRAASDIMLRDRDLAKPGFLAQLDAQCKSNIATAIKGVDGLNFERFCPHATTVLKAGW